MKKYIFVLTIFTLSFSLFGKGGYQLSLASLFITYLVLTSSKNTFLKTFIIAAYTIIIFLSQIFVSNGFEFMKSFFYFTFTTIIFFDSQKRKIFVTREEMKKFVSIALVIIISFELLQVIEGVVFSSNKLMFIFDPISISTAEDSGRFEAVNFLGYIRPFSFYHEPSYLGSVLFILLIIEKNIANRKFLIILATVGIVLTFSMLNYLFLLLYLAQEVYKKNKFLFVSIFLFLSIGWGYSILIFLRLNEIQLEGSSAWARLILPMLEIKREVIQNLAIFGRALGNTTRIFDNSFFLIIAYFGVLTPVYFIYLIKYSSQIIRKKEVIFGIGNLLMLNGAIYTPESAFLLFILIISTRIAYEKTLNNNLSTKRPLFHSIQRRKSPKIKAS